MKILATTVFLAFLASCVADSDVLQSTEQAVTNGVITLTCPSTVTKASAVGTYGGVGFGIACKKNKTTVQPINGLMDANYNGRIGFETPTYAGDCFFSGTAPDSFDCGFLGLILTFE